MKVILALDLGSTTGWALEAMDYSMACGSWTLCDDKTMKEARRNRMDRLLDPRIPALWAKISEIHTRYGINWLVWEDVRFSTYTNQTQLWSSFRTVCWLFAARHGLRTECIDVSTLKKFATGHGNADKALMAWTVADKRFVKSNGRIVDSLTGAKLDDNAVDALHLLRWAKSILE